MPCQVALSGERLPTDVTCLWFQSTMAVTVNCKVSFHCKHLTTDITSEGFDAGMAKAVHVQIALQSKCLSADITGERFDGNVGIFQVMLATEHLPAVITPVHGLTPICLRRCILRSQL